MSNLIKQSNYIPVVDKKIIHVLQKTLAPMKEEISIHPLEEDHADELKDPFTIAEAEIKAAKEQILKDAEEYAELQIKQAIEEVVSIKKQAEDEINGWWEEQRKLDIEYIDKAKAEGHEQGYQEGLVTAEAAIREELAKILDESKSILETAHLQKLQIINEAEPFLIELSCEISKKIINKQLTLSPEWIVDLVKQTLVRKREQGMITLCVSPSHFSYIQDARDELALAIDSQAELQILPDGSIKDHGCVIRSSLGSIDARIDTQLTEIKNALNQLAQSHEDDLSND